MKRIDVPEFEERNDLFKFLKTNKNQLIAEKKWFGKEADAISYVTPLFDPKTKSFKAGLPAEELLAKDELMVKIVINTTNLFDTHADVHLKGIWKKFLKESGKNCLHLQEHKSGFQFVIADGIDGEVKAYVEEMSWKDLGYSFKGTTEALIFESKVAKARNPFMFEQYAKGYVKNHSVGMQYVKVTMCINSEEKYYIEEKENWEKYIDEIANKDAAEERGYFWAVHEGKAPEGSAVVRGSNFATPTMEIKSEPGIPLTEKEPIIITPSIDYSYLTKNLFND